MTRQFDSTGSTSLTGPGGAVAPDEDRVFRDVGRNLAGSPAGAVGEADGGLLVTLCFAGATFLGAFLLFLVQPLIAKYILPWYGGGAVVWTTCMLFFQTTLLGGYLYAHLGVSRLNVKAQAIVHGCVLVAAAAAALPAIAPAQRWKEAAGSGHPTAQILLLLLATVGLPCLALAATSPLLHAWYSRIRPGAAVYRLYALSNLGSLLALLCYPLVVEPLLSRRTQAGMWSALMAAFAVLCAGCVVLAVRHARPLGILTNAPGNDGASGTDAATGNGEVALATPYVGQTVKPGVALLLWLALPACATSLLLATTNTMTQDFAPIPFLWVLPLALYLLTFIIAFDRPGWYYRPVFVGLLVAGCAAVVWVLQDDAVLPPKSGVLALAFALFAACMVLHGELARLRPPAARLTSYYLAIAAGGALGGLLVAVGAPMLLRSHAEFQIALFAACLLAFAAPLLAERRAPGAAAAFLVPVALVVLGRLLWATSSGYTRGGEQLERVRDFYGVLSVWDVDGSGGKGRMLYHGSITHGHQFTRPDKKNVPTTYYMVNSGVGRLLGPRSPLPQPRRVALIGLGTGTIAAYAQAGDVYRYYEISPNVERLARKWFTYLSDAEARGADVKVLIGDARLTMERHAEPQGYHAIAVDAFSGDAIPVHLLTLEALELYGRHLAPGGVVAIHVSNRYLDLHSVVAANAGKLGWHSIVVDSDVSREEGYSAGWVLVSPDAAPIESFKKLHTTRADGQPRKMKPWTDEHANVLGALE